MSGVSASAAAAAAAVAALARRQPPPISAHAASGIVGRLPAAVAAARRLDSIDTVHAAAGPSTTPAASAAMRAVVGDAAARRAGSPGCMALAGGWLLSSALWDAALADARRAQDVTHARMQAMRDAPRQPLHGVHAPSALQHALHALRGPPLPSLMLRPGGDVPPAELVAVGLSPVLASAVQPPASSGMELPVSEGGEDAANACVHCIYAAPGRERCPTPPNHTS
eukprot:363978-Chlamydomonas_euryale.AAC.9